MKKQISEHANTARQIRKILKDNNISAKVSCKSYSMGSSCNVQLTNLSPWVYEGIVSELDRFEYGTFDGMTDCSGIKNRGYDNPQVKHLFINNNFTDDVLTKARSYIENRMELSQFTEYDIQRMTNQYLRGDSQLGCYFKKPKTVYCH